MPRDPTVAIPVWAAALGYRDLHIDRTHVLALARLPDIHRDPFDRIMVAQAVVEDLTLVTRDALIHKYPVATMAA